LIFPQEISISPEEISIFSPKMLISRRKMLISGLSADGSRPENLDREV
jgi:hypothetical protein